MTYLTLIIAVVIGNLVIAQIAFVILRYFVLKRQSCYENELEILNDQLKNDKISRPLFNQEKQKLRREFNVKFYERWWSRK